MIPERASLEFYDEKYIEDVIFNVRRNGRKSGYLVNLEGTLKYAWSDNISFHIYLYEFLHNEYRPTFVELHFEKFCQLIKDKLIGKALNNAGLTKCPLTPKRYVLSNMSMPFDNFHYIWPFEKARGDGIFIFNKTVIAKGSLYMRFLKN
ncbi:uncharacterized protein LOC114352112 [Ostrinia furnacalis]|uniref:uncharacterized protein LOC114352112 n=1 Tax=Ostrinia furnacalis TaxID=93504 RepID=UPI0010388341|nr:uncharacterized protein LOC114352112 [Ostrinia furnacalis]